MTTARRALTALGLAALLPAAALLAACGEDDGAMVRDLDAEGPVGTAPGTVPPGTAPVGTTPTG